MEEVTRTALNEREREEARLVRDAESLADLEIADLRADGRLVRKARRPVMTVRQGARGWEEDGLQRLLVGADLSPMMQPALARAGTIAAASRAELADEEAMDLIVTSPHGRSGPPRLVVGSTTEHLVRRAPCPVLTVSDPPPRPGT